MSDHQALLLANEAFYRAFADRDPDAMRDLWSKTAPVVCIHPGWGAIDGREEVIETWLAIMSNPGAPAIDCHAATAYPHGDTGFVVCYEEIDGQFLIATNVFVREGKIWKMVHHQAGPTADEPPIADSEEPELVN